MTGIFLNEHWSKALDLFTILNQGVCAVADIQMQKLARRHLQAVPHILQSIGTRIARRGIRARVVIILQIIQRQIHGDTLGMGQVIQSNGGER